ncbi:MAG: ferritin family protein [Syntrophobacteraceae bacterium]
MTAVTCSSVDDVINFAIEKEQRAMDFYLQCAGRATNKGIKTFFEEMAKEEERHRELLKSLDPAGLSDFKLDKVEDLQISQYLVDVKFTDDLTYQEALTLSMKKEEKAYEFYSAWKGKCMHEKTAKIFEMLAQEEMKHKRSLENKYDDEILSWD